MADPNAHQSLTNTSPSFSVSMNLSDRRDAPRNFVFVDEKNRHRRLKVVRACEGCRKRKIKCDAANTNTWPCSACVRIKINCVPPSLNVDSDDSFEYESESSQAIASFQPASKEDFTHMQLPQNSATDQRSFLTSVAPMHVARLDDGALRGPPDFTNLRFEGGGVDPFSSLGHPYGPSSSASIASSSTDTDWRSETSDTEFTEALGDLRISDVAIAPYMINQKGLADAPAVQEEEVTLPWQSGSGLTVRIPDEMMPSEQKSLQYFQYFFDNIHPYVPVVYPPYFYRQWHQGKDSISPLILEGIFACSSYMMDQTLESSRWLALASRHEESFKDVPRLSTLQGLLLLLKAREAVPKRGYYYRSWMTVVNMVAMAKDLGLDSHYQLHKAGRVCGSPDQECIVKTRVWHTLYVLELMIGGPQGRTEYNVHSDTVNFDAPSLSSPATSPVLDDHEQQVDEQFAQLMRIVRNVREATKIMIQLRNQKTDWALDYDFVQHNSKFDSWLQNLPRHLDVSFPAGDVAPWVPSHFVGNIHTYHRLSIIMHHRPQLQQSTPGAFDDSWKRHMMTCYQAAKEMLLVQEAIFQQFGLVGLSCMQRGLGFSVYSILTCVMLHLVAVTSPDEDINRGSPDYFCRHMRILEKCYLSWPIKEVQIQIDSIRQAFSENVNEPFQLRSNFPGSPPRSDRSSPPFVNQNFTTRPLPTPGEDLPLAYVDNMANAVAYQSPDSLPVTSAGLDNYSSSSSSTPQSVIPQATYWDPSRIFNQWNTAFGMPSATTSVGAQSTMNSFTSPAQPGVSSNQHPSYSQSQPYITPVMWQEAVSGTMKRRWGESVDSQRKRRF